MQTSFGAVALARHEKGLWEKARQAFETQGFIKVTGLLSEQQVEQVRGRFPNLFAGKFDTGIYPDEWHWREGISKPDAFREIVNGWKSDSVISKVVLSEDIGRLASGLLGWTHGARIGQDDVLWKPPLASEVAFHQDSAYISTQFVPEQNSVTVWIALDPADEETGVVEYCPGSHRWKSLSGASATTSSFHGSRQYDATLLEAAQRAGIESVPDVVRLTVEPGSAVFHHQDVWHGSARNKSSTRHRRALGIHLVRRDARWRRDRHPDYIYGRYYMGHDAVEERFFPSVYVPPTQKL